jgi:hypothetical protein
MNADEDPPGLETESPPRPAEGETKNFRLINTSLPLGTQARPPCIDRHLARYLTYTRALNAQAGGSPAGEFYLDIALRLYSEFCRSCNGHHRKCSWAAIQSALTWIVTLPSQTKTK